MIIAFKLSTQHIDCLKCPQRQNKVFYNTRVTISLYYTFQSINCIEKQHFTNYFVILNTIYLLCNSFGIIIPK